MSIPLNIVSLSFGKDSLAMAHQMLFRPKIFGHVDCFVFFDTGWEFDEIYQTKERFEQLTGRIVTTLRPKKSFDYYFHDHPVTRTDNPRTGYGWPSDHRRWCTRKKQDTINGWLGKLYKQYKTPISISIGLAADEQQRTEHNAGKVRSYVSNKYPLIDLGMSEADCLALCRRLGYSWGGVVPCS